MRDARDKAAFSELFDYFGPRLKGFVMRSGMSAAQAEEVVQDVMLTVWRKADLFDPHRAQVSAWIPEELREDPEVEPDASQILAVEQEAGKLKDALARLNENQRVILEKAYLGELTHQEISAQTGLPLGTIKSRIRLGLERLRHELGELR